MGIKKTLLPFFPSPILWQYRKIKRFFVAPRRKFCKTGNNTAETRSLHLNEAILREKKTDKVKIIQYLEWENPFDTNAYGKYQYQVQEFAVENSNKIELDFNNYGAWTVEINYLQGKKTIGKEVVTINVAAKEYNIAYLSATLPAEIFLINLWNITSAKTPTIVGLERVLFNYNELPENVFPFPLATEEELNTDYKGFYSYSQRLVSYISMLYQMNPEVKFNLYLCDHQAFYTLALMYSNRIPENNFSVFLLSDGTGSYDGFNYVFGNNNRIKIYNAMKETWNLAKKMAKESGVQQWKKENFIFCGNPSVSQTQKSDNQMIELSNRQAYAYVITRESQNFSWLLHNPDLLDANDKANFPLTDSIKKIDFISGIKSLEKHQSELIKLLGIDYSVFGKSHYTKKKICVLLGSFPPNEADMQYIDATIERFGNEYDYYFKEHPHIQVSNEKMKAIKSRGIEFLNSKIPTEIYMMIDPDIYLAGYLSSAFLSIDLLHNPAEQILSIWDVSDRKIKTSCLAFSAKTAMSLKNNSIVIYDK